MLKKQLHSLILTDEDKAEIKDYYNKYHEDTISVLTYSAFAEFSRIGKRIGYEAVYFNRRKRINSTVMMYIAYGCEYLDELCDLLWAVCDEYTWALPAHVKSFDCARYEIDLFAAETSMMLAEISYLLEDVLPDEVKNRIFYEVNNRVLDIFQNRTFHWETAAHNWSAVCCGCIGMTYLYLCPDKLPTERILSAMDCYLSGCGDDGVCLEGLGYWSYGFGYYMYFAKLFKERIGIDIMHKDKVIALAKFQQNMYLGKECISCSDAPRDAAPLAGLTGILCKLFPNDVYAPATIKTTRSDDCGRWAHYIRSFLYTPLYNDNSTGEYVYNNSQWYINKKSHYSFFIKGGNNDEPHNHNDVGSFILADKDGQILCDIGCGEYTSDYFNPQTRYNYLCNSSLGHNVPIIDGKEQLWGKDYCCDKFDCGNNRAVISFGGAYGDGINIVRTVLLEENCIILRDKSSGAHKITERFVSCVKPVIKDGQTIIGSFCVDAVADISEELINDHSGNPITVYLLDFEVCDNVFEIIFREVL